MGRNSAGGTVTGNTKPNAAWVFKMLLILSIGGTALAAAGAGGVFWYFSRGLPNIITVADYRPLTVTRIQTGADNPPNLIAEFYKERRYLVPYEKIPEHVVKAFTSAEDDQFFEHSGINLLSMVRAGIANFRAGHVVQGGSTITQQVAKSLLLTPERSFVRKIREVILSQRIEQHLSKQQILYLYLNQIYLGHGAYGVQAASRTYFRKDVGDITVAEAAILAGLPQAPSKYSPILAPQKAKDRQRYVLRRMAENGYITQAQMAEAVAIPVPIFDDEELNARHAPYLVEHVRRHLLEKFGEKALYEDGLVVTLPTSLNLLTAARKSLVDGLEVVDKRVGYRGPLKNLANDDEIEKFLRESRLALISKKVQHQLLMADGRFDPIEAMKKAGIHSDQQLLVTGEKYKAVVMNIDDKKKSAGVLIGAVKAEIPMEQMRWAHPVRDEKNPKVSVAEPKAPSKVVKRGDVIFVRVLENSDKGVIASLEQEPQVQGSLFSLDVRTGAVLAMEGGFDFKSSEFNRAFQAQRQPGSSYKPIIYAAGLEKGYTPATVIMDSPIVYEDGDTGKWKPSNFEEKFYGDTTFRQALIKSRNVPTIKIVQSIQVPFLLDYSKRIGLNGQFNADLSISLGSGSVTLVDLTKAYALFPRLGRRVSPIFLAQVQDRDGKLLEENKPGALAPVSAASAAPSTAPSAVPSAVASVAAVAPSGTGAALPQGAPSPLVHIPQLPTAEDPEQVLDPRVAFVMTHLMKEVVAYGTGHAAQGLQRPAAGKTGTTNDYIDAWFMGFTPHVVTGAWVGFDNHRTIGPSETGARAALPIWLNFMREAVKQYPDEDFAVPPGVVFATIDPTSGKLAPPNSSTAIKEAFIEGSQPTETADKGGASTGSPGDFFKEDIE